MTNTFLLLWESKREWKRREVRMEPYEMPGASLHSHTVAPMVTNPWRQHLKDTTASLDTACLDTAGPQSQPSWQHTTYPGAGRESGPKLTCLGLVTMEIPRVFQIPAGREGRTISRLLIFRSYLFVPHGCRMCTRVSEERIPDHEQMQGYVCISMCFMDISLFKHYCASLRWTEGLCLNLDYMLNHYYSTGYKCEPTGLCRLQRYVTLMCHMTLIVESIHTTLDEVVESLFSFMRDAVFKNIYNRYNVYTVSPCGQCGNRSCTLQHRKWLVVLYSVWLISDNV